MKTKAEKLARTSKRGGSARRLAVTTISYWPNYLANSEIRWNSVISDVYKLAGRFECDNTLQLT